MTKILVRSHTDDGSLDAVSFGRAARRRDGVLVIGSAPGEWLLLAPPGAGATVNDGFEPRLDEDLPAIFDVTHGRALVRLAGPASSSLLAKLCPIDLGDDVTPDGAAFRSTVGGLVTDVVRDDDAGERSYLLGCERSYGGHLFDVLLDAGRELGIEIDGFDFPESTKDGGSK